MSGPLARLDTIESAIAAIKDGRPVVVIDDEDRENEGDLIFAAELATPELVAFMVRYTSGYICVRRHRGRRRPARPAADVPGQPGPARHRLHGHRRRPRGRDAPASRPPTARTPSGCSPTPRRRRPTSPDPATSCRCGPRTAACCAGPATPRPRSTSPSWPACGPPARSARSSARRTRPAWPAARSCASSPTSTTSCMISIADLIAYRKRFDKLVERVAEAIGAAGAGQLHRRRLPQLVRQPRARRLRLRRHRRRRGRARPRALRVPHRRRLRLAALRLRPAAAGRAGRRRPGGPRHRALHPRPRGPGDRPAAQAAGLPAAGHRARTPSTPTSTWACPPTPATTAPARRSWSTSACARCGC